MPLPAPILPVRPALLRWPDRGRCVGWFATVVWLGLWPKGSFGADSGAPKQAATRVSNAAIERTGTWIVVQREPGSESCPDADAVFRAMELLFPERYFRRAQVPAQALANAAVKIRPTEDGHEARVEVLSPRHGERAIVEQDPNCRGLADALAVALAMLTDAKGASSHAANGSVNGSASPAFASPDTASSAVSQPQPLQPGAEVQPPSASTSASAPPVAKSAPKPSATPDRSKGSRTNRGSAPDPAAIPKRAALEPATPTAAKSDAWSLRPHAGLIGGLSILTQPMGGGLVGAGAWHASGFGIELSGIGLWATPAKDGRGGVRVSRVGALLGACRERPLGSRGSFQICIEFGLGDQDARIKDFDRVYVPRQHDLWIWLGPKLQYVHQLASWFGGFASVGALVNLKRDNIIVEDSSTASVRANWIGLVAETGIRLTGPVF